MGVFDRKEDCGEPTGGLGALREGMKVDDCAASVFSSRRAWNSRIDALEGVWYSTVID